VAYQLDFKYIHAFECREIEVCRWKVESSFDEIQDSDWISELRLGEKGYQHYILSTYGYAYRIIAKEFELVITGTR
jgi:hypothetical protein